MLNPSQRFQAGLACYRSGDHYEAHEIWEEIWDSEGDEERRLFLQALIQIASAVHKARNDVAPRGAVRLVERALERLAPLDSPYLGLDLRALEQSCRPFVDEVKRQMEQSGHCRIDARWAPEMPASGAMPMWLSRAQDPAVPEGARAAWFERGLVAYRAGEFFDAHEFWEELWRDEADAYQKQFLQGLIQVAAAMHKCVAQEKPAPAARLLERALLRLRQSSPNERGIDVLHLVRACETTRERLLAMDAGPFPKKDVPPIGPPLAALDGRVSEEKSE